MGVFNWRCHYEEYAHAAEQAREHAQLAGQRRSDLFRLDRALVYGPRPAEEALRTIDALLPENPHPSVLLFRAWLLTMLANFDEAAQLASEAGRRWRELSGDDGSTGCSASSRRQGATTRPQPPVSDAYATSPRRGRSGFSNLRASPRTLAVRARPLRRSRALGELGRTLDKTGQDVFTQALWRQVQALVHAHRGRHAEAEALAREAVAVLEPTDALNMQGDALYDLGDVLATAGHQEAASSAFQQALARYERKQIIPLARRTRERLAALQAPTA